MSVYLSFPLFLSFLDRPLLSLFFGSRNIVSSIFVKVAIFWSPNWPLAAGCELARDGYIWAPWERTGSRWGDRWGARGCEQNRNAGMWGIRGRGEKARRRIEIRIDTRKSSGTRPTFGYSCDRSFLSLFSIFLLPLCSFNFPLALFSPASPHSSLPDRILPLTPPISFSFVSSKAPRFLDWLDLHFRQNP